jgi:hypothetical protein
MSSSRWGLVILDFVNSLLISIVDKVLLLCNTIGRSWGHLGASLGHYDPYRGYLAAILGHLGDIWVPSWPQFGAMLGPSWPSLRSSYAMLGNSELAWSFSTRLKPYWGPCWDNFRPCRTPTLQNLICWLFLCSLPD